MGISFLCPIGKTCEIDLALNALNICYYDHNVLQLYRKYLLSFRNKIINHKFRIMHNKSI